MFTISPSLYSADLLNIRQVLQSIDNFEHLHLDIDDGNFVRGISFGMALVDKLAVETAIPLDAHLEVLNPMEYVDPLCKAGVELICAHVEVLDFPSLFLSSVHQNGKKAGLALNLKTPISYIEPYADQIDQLILVSCEADVDGLPFRKGVLKKIIQARQVLAKDTLIWVDGGVNEGNLQSVVQAGASGVVLGRAIFDQADPAEEYDRLLELGRQYERRQKDNEI